MAPVVRNSPANVGDTRVVDSNPGLGRSLGVGNGNTLQYSFQDRKFHGQEEPIRLQSTGSQRVRHNWARTYRVLFMPIKYSFYKQYYLLAEKHYTSLHICIEIHHLITDTEIFCFCFSITYERIVGFKLSFCNQNKVNYSDVLNILLMSME